MIISRQAINAYLDRELDDFTWMKRLSRRELQAELRYFTVPPKFKTDPWLHQLVCFFIAAQHRRFLFLLDMGLGKSKIILDAMTQRQRQKQLKRGLVFVPNVVNMESWKDDALRHSDLEPWACDTTSIAEKWERLVDPDGDFTVIDYQGLVLAVCGKKAEGKKGKVKLVPNDKRLRQLEKTYNFVAIDESHKLRNFDSLWFDVVQRITAPADFVYATTGTVFGKNPEAMWSQFKLVDGGETFGGNLGLFRASMFSPETDGFSAKWVFRKSCTNDLHRMMQHRSIRYDEAEVPETELPQRMPPIVQRMRMASEQREHYLRALDSLINAQGSGDATAMDAPWTRMRQIVSGYLVWKDADGTHTVRFKENPKLDALEATINAMGDAKIVVCHYYTETGAMIMDRLKEMRVKAEWLHGGTKDKVGAKQRFIDDPACTVFVMNTEAGGTGNDGLQKVANYMAMYESPTVPDVRRQVEKRIDRPGQKKRTFFIDYVMRGSADQTILDNIAEGRDLYDAVVNGRLKARDLTRG